MSGFVRSAAVCIQKNPARSLKAFCFISQRKNEQLCSRRGTFALDCRLDLCLQLLKFALHHLLLLFKGLDTQLKGLNLSQ